MSSTPAMSSVRNVALFGRPSGGPVIASTSSIVYSPAATLARIRIIAYRPMWLPMKLGESLAIAGVFGTKRQDRFGGAGGRNVGGSGPADLARSILLAFTTPGVPQHTGIRIVEQNAVRS